jgi:hypothetical protein
MSGHVDTNERKNSTQLVIRTRPSFCDVGPERASEIILRKRVYLAVDILGLQGIRKRHMLTLNLTG